MFMDILNRLDVFNRKSIVCLLIITVFSTISFSQSYHALNGSPFAGITSMYVNPASPVNSFYKWDASLIGLQFKMDQNFGYIKNTSLSSNDLNNIYDTSYAPNNGQFNRYFHGILDGQGLSFRYRIKEKTSIGFSFRGRTYNQLKTNELFFHDSINTLNGFLKSNLSNPNLNSSGIHGGWMETNFNLSQIIVQNSSSKLSIGANIGLTKALSGAYFNGSSLQYQELTNPANNNVYYQAVGNNGTLSYLASNNLTYFDTIQVNSTSIKEFYKSTYSSLIFSVGVEYMIVDETVEDNINNLNYTWKFGASILDIGTLKHDYQRGSATHRVPNTTFVDTSINTRFNNITSLSGFRNAVSPLFNSTDSLQGSFTISAPTRIVASVDRNFGGGLFANFQASINIFSSNSSSSVNTREMNLFTLTPRWETQGFGFYLPMQYNVNRNFWMGAAVKIGPLIVGIHDLGVLGWFKTKNQTFNGGGYVMLNIYPYKNKYNDNSIKCTVL